MLCEKCKKNEAKINLVKIVNGEKMKFGYVNLVLKIYQIYHL